MSSIRVYTPEGLAGMAPRALAELPPALAGQRIALLDNGKPNAAALLRRVAEQVAQRSGARVVGLHQKANAALPCQPELLARLAGETDLILTGSAD